MLGFFYDTTSLDICEIHNGPVYFWVQNTKQSSLALSKQVGMWEHILAVMWWDSLICSTLRKNCPKKQANQSEPSKKDSKAQLLALCKPFYGLTT